MQITKYKFRMHIKAKCFLASTYDKNKTKVKVRFIMLGNHFKDNHGALRIFPPKPGVYPAEWT